MSEGPRYSEEEVALILERAASLQQKTPHPGDSRSMSLAEVEKVASEVGISRALVRRAASQVATKTSTASKPNWFLGGPRTISLETFVDGEFPVDRFDFIVEAIRNVSDQIGQISTVGRTITWTGGSSGSSINATSISVSVRDGQTRLRYKRNLDQLIGGIFGGVLGGVGGGLSPLVAITLGLTAGPLGVMAGVFGTVGLTYAGCRKLFANRAEAAREEGRAVLEELAMVCKSEIADSEAPRALPAAADDEASA